MGKVDICDRDLTQRFDGSAEESLQDLVRDPLAVGLGVGGPDLDCQRGEDRNQIDRSFPVLKGKRLPDKASLKMRKNWLVPTEMKGRSSVGGWR